MCNLYPNPKTVNHFTIKTIIDQSLHGLGIAKSGKLLDVQRKPCLDSHASNMNTAIIESNYLGVFADSSLK